MDQQKQLFSLWYNIPTKIFLQNGIISIGQPTIETEALIVDDENNIVKDGERRIIAGEISYKLIFKNEEKDKKLLFT